MIALVRYHTALLLRSQRWLAPLVLYAGVLVVGIRSGEPLLGSLGLVAAALVPVTAWLVRIGVGNEPPEARGCAAAPHGPPRAHLAALLAASGAAGAVGLTAVVVVTAVGGAVNDTGTRELSRPAAGACGLLAALTCVLLGAAVGALTTRPVLRSRGWGLLVMLLGLVAVLIAAGSPVRTVLTALTEGSREGTVPLLLAPTATAVLVAAGASALVCALSARGR
ncbi:ABC transporter [Streptomyces sp. LE64]|uniref:ABC transporter n=1 Tax=Streptomyces sp. LE64 TaxID=3448653 RepID=UPI004042B5CB